MDNGNWLAIGAAIAFALLLAAALVSYHKLSLAICRLDLQAKAHTENLFAQMEALLALQSELRLDGAMPPTRGWAASPDFLRNIMAHARRQRPMAIVECSSGVSTLVLARCAQLNGLGHVFSLEHAPEYGAQTRELLRRHGLETYATVLDAPLRNVQVEDWLGQWYSHEVLPDDLSIDMLVVDGPPWSSSPMARFPAVPALKHRLNPGAVVFLDDASRIDEKRSIERWLQRHPDLSNLPVPPCEKGCVALQLQA